MSKPKGNIFPNGKPVGQDPLLRFQWCMKYGILLSKNLVASQVFWIINHCGISSGFNKFPAVYCVGTFVFFLLSFEMASPRNKIRIN